MSEELEVLHRRLNIAGELQSVVRTMKTLAAVSIVPYERATRSLADYYRTVELGLIACFGDFGKHPIALEHNQAAGRTGVVVFGSDQGMVGQFNELLADFVLSELKAVADPKLIWPVGERIARQLTGFGIDVMPLHSVPDTVTGITPLTAAILEEIQQRREDRTINQVLVFHNRPLGGSAYHPSRQRLLPFDEEWLRGLAARRWPTKMIP